jgi:hypothetical protein
VIRQEIHHTRGQRNIPAVTKRPDRVWILLPAAFGGFREPPRLPILPRHGHNAAILDVGHDYSMHGPGGCLRTSLGGGEVEEWLLCEWNVVLNKTEQRLVAQARKSGTVVATGHEKRVPLLKLVAKGLMVEVSPGTFSLAPRAEEEKST